jgi:hypothetical protein
LSKSASSTWPGLTPPSQSMTLHARNAKGTEYGFIYTIIN